MPRLRARALVTLTTVALAAAASSLPSSATVLPHALVRASSLTPPTTTAPIAPTVRLSPPATDADNATPGNYGWFEAGLAWRGEFADPMVVKYGATYYAYSSGAGGRYLGVQTSSDGVHWLAHPRWSTHNAPWAGGPDPRTDTSIPAEIRASGDTLGNIWNNNDALVRPAAWGRPVIVNTWLRQSYWAVGVAKIGSTWFAWAPVKYSDRLADGTVDPDGFGRYCLTLATARSPLGPFRDVTGSKPWYCDPDPAGSIDPSPFVDPATGSTWLVWRSAGRISRPGVKGYPAAIKSVKIDATGHMASGIHTLLTTNEGSWEGYVIENPSMIQYKGRWYLFYSGNSFLVDRAGHSPYATGYAVCATPYGPCHRLSPSPLMASNSRESGPGGASAFIDPAGNLRLAYASYWPGEYRYYPIHQPRRMHIVTVTWHSDGTLSVVH
jgi:hypothetical protein